MPTETKPKNWKRPSNVDLHPIPSRLANKVSGHNMVPKEVRLNLVREHLPAVLPDGHEILAETIEKAARACRQADEYDKRPRSSHICARMKRLEKAAKKLHTELVKCDDLTEIYVEERSKDIGFQQKTLPNPSLKSDMPLSDTMSYLVPFGDLCDQIAFYVKLFEDGAIKQNDKPGPQAKTALLALVKDLAVGWGRVTGNGAKGCSSFIDFVLKVSSLPSVREIIRPGEEHRRKIREAMKKVLA